MNILSPITNSENVVVEKRIPTNWLITEYKKQLNMDVSNCFKDLDEVLVCRCLDSGYCFYYPFFVAGDGDFYSELENFSWYYMDEKWEHNEALKHVKKSDKVLEIGSGRGGFLSKALDRAEISVGLELNESAAAEARSRGLNVLTETLEIHAQSHQNFYDVVCSFQVFEHVPQVNKFIQTSLDVLKTDGLLIICVPNNESFIIQENILIMNMPPHHMGLWTLNSLLALQKFFCMKAEFFQFESLQRYHLGYGTEFLMKKLSSLREDFFARKNSTPQLSFIKRAIVKLARIRYAPPPPFPFQEVAELSASVFSPYLPGHSIFVVYKKMEK